MSETKWVRIRFHANPIDSRPIIWPPLGPFWESAISDNYAVVIAYFPGEYNEETLKKYWPEAASIEFEANNEIVFNDRFQCPEYWDAANNCFIEEKPPLTAEEKLKLIEDILGFGNPEIKYDEFGDSYYISRSILHNLWGVQADLEKGVTDKVVINTLSNISVALNTVKEILEKK